MRKRAWAAIFMFVFWTVFAWLWCNTDPAKAEILIRNDGGGQIGAYVETLKLVNASGEMVVIDGNCLSACTLVLGLVPKGRICITDKARLGFHAAWHPDEEGKPVQSEPGTQALWFIYPEHIRRWITRHGGLTGKMIYLEGPTLTRMYQQCRSVPPAATSAQASSPLQITIHPASKSRAKH